MPKLKMCPTSIAVWNTSAPPHSGQRSPSRGSRMSAKRGCVVAAGLDAAQMPAVAVRAGDELALAQRLVGDHLAREADRAERAAARRRTPRGSPRRSPAASRRRARAAASSRSSRSSPRTSASTTVPSSFDDRHRLRGRGASMPRNSASASIVVTPGVSTSSGASSRSREVRRARNRRARPRGRRRSRRSRSVTSVFSPEPEGARKSIARTCRP